MGEQMDGQADACVSDGCAGGSRGSQMFGGLAEQYTSGRWAERGFRWVCGQMCRWVAAWIGRGKDEPKMELPETDLSSPWERELSQRLVGPEWARLGGSGGPALGGAALVTQALNAPLLPPLGSCVL